MDAPKLFNEQAETAVIGAVLIGNLMPGEYDIKPDDFFLDRHKKIWQAFESLRGSAIDLITAAEELQRAGQLDFIGGQAYLMKLVNSPESYLHIDHYAGIVIDYAKRRKMLDQANRLASGAVKGEYDIAKIIHDISGIERGKGEAVHVSIPLGNLAKEVEARAAEPKEIWGIPTGFIDLDERIGGLQPQQTLYLSAPPGRGKSVLAGQIARNAANHCAGTIFSFEMRAERNLMRLLSAESNIPTRAMNSGKMEKYWTEFYSGIETLGGLPLYISDIYGMTSARLRSEVARLKARHNIQFMVIDYLDKLLDNDGGGRNEDTELKAQRVQGICREFNIAGIIIQSMTKEGFSTLVPTLDNMRGPSTVAHEGDNVFLLGEHPDDKKNMIRLFPAKLRDGDIGFSPIDLIWIKGVPKFGSAARKKEVMADNGRDWHE